MATDDDGNKDFIAAFAKYNLRCQLRGHTDEVHAICLLDNGGIATSSRDQTIRIWSLDQAGLYTTPPQILQGNTGPVRSLAWAPVSHQYPKGLLVSGGMDTKVLVWDLANGGIVRTLEGHKMQVTGLALDGSNIVSSSADGVLICWKSDDTHKDWDGHYKGIHAVKRLSDGCFISASTDKSIKIWNGHSRTGTSLGHTDTVRSLAVLPNVGFYSASHDWSIRAWTLNGHMLNVMWGHKDIVCSIDVHKSGLLVSGSDDRHAKIWKQGIVVQSLEHPGCVLDVKFMEDRDVITACSDGVIRIWTTQADKIAAKGELETYSSELETLSRSRALQNMQPSVQTQLVHIGRFKLSDRASVPGLYSHEFRLRMKDFAIFARYKDNERLEHISFITKATILITTTPDLMRNYQAKLDLLGTSEDHVDKAKQEIEEIIRKRYVRDLKCVPPLLMQMDVANPPSEQRTISISLDKATSVLGEHNSKIVQLEKETGCWISVRPFDGDNTSKGGYTRVLRVFSTNTNWEKLHKRLD